MLHKSVIDNLQWGHEMWQIVKGAAGKSGISDVRIWHGLEYADRGTDFRRYKKLLYLTRQFLHGGIF
jgi:hypothetical protein